MVSYYQGSCHNCSNTLQYLRVNSEVETHKFNKLRVIKAKHAGIVPAPILLFVNRVRWVAFTVEISVDNCSNSGQLSNQIHGVFIT